MNMVLINLPANLDIIMSPEVTVARNGPMGVDSIHCIPSRNLLTMVNIPLTAALSKARVKVD